MEKYTVKLKRLEESKWLPSEFKKIDPGIELLATLNIDKETRIVNDILYKEFQKWL